MSNIKALPVSGHANQDKDVANWLREMAQAIESGGRTNIRQLVVIVESGGELETWAIGGPCDNARLVGLLTIAASKAMRIEE